MRALSETPVSVDSVELRSVSWVVSGGFPLHGFSGGRDGLSLVGAKGGCAERLLLAAHLHFGIACMYLVSSSELAFPKA